VVHTEQQIDWLATHKTTWPHRVFLKLNSGMNRLGFTREAFRTAWLRLSGLTQVDEISLMTHFADADNERGIAHQVAQFQAATADLPGERSLCNSAATLRYAGALAEVRADWVRPGLMVYGSAPDFPTHSPRDWGLLPGMTLRSQLIATQTLKAGDTVGYGSTFTAPHAMRIGVVACGYADGYPRHCGTGTPVLVDGVRTRLVGRVSMDMLTVELTPVEQAGRNAAIGAEVTLWGQGPRGSLLPIDEVAMAGNTVAYELMCALAPRVPVVVRDLCPHAE
jgi:alanine racemase